jgi:hypothetical protein
MFICTCFCILTQQFKPTGLLHQTIKVFSEPVRLFRVNISLRERKLGRNQCLLALSVFAQLFQAFVAPLIVVVTMRRSWSNPCNQITPQFPVQKVSGP